LAYRTGVALVTLCGGKLLRLAQHLHASQVCGAASSPVTVPNGYRGAASKYLHGMADAMCVSRSAVSHLRPPQAQPAAALRVTELRAGPATTHYPVGHQLHETPSPGPCYSCQRRRCCGACAPPSANSAEVPAPAAALLLPPPSPPRAAAAVARSSASAALRTTPGGRKPCRSAASARRRRRCSSTMAARRASSSRLAVAAEEVGCIDVHGH
jgi:hypothetical protein